MKKIWKSKKWGVLIGFGVLVIALFLRLYNLTILPVFGDEAIYIRWAQVMRAEPTLRFLPLSDGKQPLFMWSVIPFLKIFSDPLFAGRSVSVISGVGTSVGIFVLAYLLFRHKKTALFASLIYAVSPFSVFFDRLALSDSMLSMFGVWALVFAVITVRKIRLDSAMLAGFMLGGAYLTKSPASIFTFLLPSTLLLSDWGRSLKKIFFKLSVLVFLFTFTYGIGFALYNILRLGPNFQMIAIRNKDYVYPFSHIFTSPLDPLLPYLDRIVEYYWILAPSILLFLIIIGIYFGLKTKPKETLILLAWSIIPIVAFSEFSKTMTARYVYFSVPYLFILAGLSTFCFKQELQSVKLKHFPDVIGIGSHFGLVIKIMIIFFFIHALFIDSQLLVNPQAANLPRSERSGYLEEWTSGYGIKEVSEYMREQAKNLPAGRQVIVGTEGYFGTLPDGLQIYLHDLPAITIIGVGLPIREVPISLIESRRSGNKTYLVVNSTRLSAQPEDLGLDIIAFYPKAVRPDQSQESLLLFEVSNAGVEK